MGEVIHRGNITTEECVSYKIFNMERCTNLKWDLLHWNNSGSSWKVIYLMQISVTVDSFLSDCVTAAHDKNISSPLCGKQNISHSYFK